MTVIRQATPHDVARLTELCELLQDAVDGGASVGLLAPLAGSTAAGYWRSVFAAMGPSLAMWVAEEQGRIVGSVQLALSDRQNGQHRAEVQKLLVSRPYRGRGVASQLMSTLEAFAASSGRTLLILDTQKGCAAESLYRRLGWSRAGEIPDFAAAPDGRLQATVIYFKQLGA